MGVGAEHLDKNPHPLRSLHPCVCSGEMDNKNSKNRRTSRKWGKNRKKGIWVGRVPMLNSVTNYKVHKEGLSFIILFPHNSFQDLKQYYPYLQLREPRLK